MMIKVAVTNYGTFEIDERRIAELLNWLSINEAVSIRENTAVKEVKNNAFTGRELINEGN